MPSWWDHFCNRQKELGLPFTTDTPLKTMASGLAIVKAFTDFAKDIGVKQMTTMSLTTFCKAMLDRGAYNAAVKKFIEEMAKQGIKATPRVVGAQLGTASGAVTTAGAILASAYIGLLIGCAIYATDKCLGGALDEGISSASAGFWHWYYGGSARDRETNAMEQKLRLMRILRNDAQRLGVLPSQLAERAAAGEYLYTTTPRG
jgi:hypothetical protein